MKLFHGSKKELIKIEPRQAVARTDISVPDSEVKYAIYATQDYGYALAMAARPRGVTKIDNNLKTISFEKPELFNPDDDVFVYQLDIDDSMVKKIDSNQIIIENIDEVTPVCVYKHKAGDIKTYYEIKNEYEKEKKSWMKLR